MTNTEYVIIKDNGGAYVAATDGSGGEGYLLLSVNGNMTRLVVGKEILVALIRASRREAARAASEAALARIKRM